MMAENNRSKSIDEAKVTGRQPAACRESAAVAPVPRNKPKAPASSDQVSWRRVDNEGESGNLQPYTATYSIGHDTSTPPKSSRRRCYTEEEKRQVAETRKRGACEECRASRTKCLHKPSAVAVVPATDQYRMQSESHEIFALGLTTSSQAVNEDEHKQVMEQTIAAIAIDDKLIITQGGPGEQSKRTNKGSSGEATDLKVFVSPPETAAGKGSSSRQRRSVPKIHNSGIPQSEVKTFEEGINKFRVSNGRAPETGKNKQQYMPKTPKENALGTKKAIGGGRAPIYVSATSTPVKRPYSEDLPTWRTELDTSRDISCPARQKHVLFGCDNFQPPAVFDNNKPWKAPSYFPYRDKPESSSLRRTSNSSDQNSHTMAMDEIMTSSGRSATPTSELQPSNPLSFASLPKLSGRSTTPDLDNPEVPISKSPQLPVRGLALSRSPDMLPIEKFSFTDYLNSSGVEDLWLTFNSAKMTLGEPLAPDHMDIDEDT